MKNGIEVKDPIYGDVLIKQTVLVELIRSRPLQRIKRINQYGIPDEFYHLPNFSRYDHCLGVMLLLQSLKASLNEQIAGLLHDVSHMAFSHLYDWVIDDYTKPGGMESRQDDGHNDFIRQSEIPEILIRHGYSVDQITNYHHFRLLERDSPNLCADRIDYSLREFPVGVARKIFSGLKVVDGQIVCCDLQNAKLFARSYLKLQTDHWGGYEAVARYHQFSMAIKKALSLGIINLDDFLVDDDHIVSRLKSSTDPEVVTILKFLKQKKLPQVSQGIKVYKKFRYIDPLFIAAEGLIRLSEVDREFRLLLKNAKDQNAKGVLVPEKLV